MAVETGQTAFFHSQERLSHGPKIGHFALLVLNKLFCNMSCWLNSSYFSGKCLVCVAGRGRSRGRVQGVRTPPPSPEMTCGFLIQLVFFKKTMWFISVEVEQETSAPPPKKNPGSAPGWSASSSSWHHLHLWNLLFCLKPPTLLLQPKRKYTN